MGNTMGNGGGGVEDRANPSGTARSASCGGRLQRGGILAPGGELAKNDYGSLFFLNLQRQDFGSLYLPSIRGQVYWDPAFRREAPRGTFAVKLLA